MNPRERITTILFIEQIKKNEAEIRRSIKYAELVQRKEEKLNGNKKNAK